MVITGAGLGELTERLWNAVFLRPMGAPASNRVVHGDSAVVPEAGRDRREPVRWNIELSIGVPAPAHGRSASTQTACVRPAGADRNEPIVRVQRVKLPMLIPTPALGPTVCGQMAAVTAAGTDAGQRRRWDCCPTIGTCPLSPSPVRPTRPLLSPLFLLRLGLLLLFRRRDLLLLFLLPRRRRGRIYDWRWRGLICRREHTGLVLVQRDDHDDRRDRQCCKRRQERVLPQPSAHTLSLPTAAQRRTIFIPRASQRCCTGSAASVGWAAFRRAGDPTGFTCVSRRALLVSELLRCRGRL